MAFKNTLNQINQIVMSLDKALSKKIGRDLTISVFIYALPVVTLFAYFALKGETPWVNNSHSPAPYRVPEFLNFLQPIFYLSRPFS